MSEAQVVVRGTLEPGTVVALVRVPDERAMRPEGGRTVDRKRVDPSGTVVFRKDIELGARYFVTGVSYGRPVDIRAIGKLEGESFLGEHSVLPDRRRNAGGQWIDPERGPEDEWLDDESPVETKKVQPKKDEPNKPAPKRRATTTKKEK
jgi:hypothetical protein